MAAALLLDWEQLEQQECNTLVRNGSFGKVAYWESDERAAQMPVRYAIDAGTIVCMVPDNIIEPGRLVPIAFEAYGCDVDGLMWDVVVQGRARQIRRAPDLQIVRTLRLPPPEPGHVPLRIIADTMSGTRAPAPPPPAIPLLPPRQLRGEQLRCW